LNVHRTKQIWLPLLFVFLLTVSTVRSQEPPDIGPNAGNMYPNFHLPRLDGTTETLSDYRGQKIILFQFASW
jgi:hypothetical protein